MSHLAAGCQFLDMRAPLGQLLAALVGRRHVRNGLTAIVLCPEKPQTSDPPVRNQMAQLKCTTHRERLWLDPEAIRGSYCTVLYVKHPEAFFGFIFLYIRI